MLCVRPLARFVLRIVAFIVPLLLLSTPVRAQQGPATLPSDTTTITGTLSYIWADAMQADALVGLPPMLVLLDEEGEAHPVALGDAVAASFGGVEAMLGHTVTLEVAPQSNAAPAPVIAVSSMMPLDATESDLAIGNERWLMLLCRPPEYTETVPNPQAHYSRLLGDEAPGMGHYWRELSYGQYSTEGSAVAGWFTLPRTWRDYVTPMAGAFALDAVPVKADCTAAADATVYFPDYDGIVFVVPVVSLGIAADMPNWYAWAWYGKTDRMDLDGVSRAYRTTYFPIEVGAWAWNGPKVWSHSILPHEIGHTLGLPHSSGAYGATYDSGWDVMGGSQWLGRSYQCERDAEFGCLAPHTIAFHKALLGWIPPEQTVVAEPESSRMLILASPTAAISATTSPTASVPTSSTQPVLEVARYLKIPMLGSSTRFYTAEARGGSVYEGSVPADAIVLHDVDTARGVRAYVVDPDLNGDPNDAAAAWVPGETFSDPLNEVNFCVEAATDVGYVVGVGSGVPAPCTFAPWFASSKMNLSPPSAAPGATVRNELSLKNGGSLAHNVAVTLTIPAELSIITDTIEAEGGELESLDPPVFRIGDMVYGAEAQLGFDLMVDPSLTTTVTPMIGGAIAWDGGSLPLREEPSALDTIPPVTTITLLGSVRSQDVVTGTASVLITAADTDSGVSTTLYSLDGGETWLVYDSLLTIAAGSCTTVEAYSVDNAGNEEQPPQRVTLRFDLNLQSVYLPAVHY